VQQYSTFILIFYIYVTLLKRVEKEVYSLRSVIIFVCILVPCTTKPDEGIGHECGLALVRLRKPLQYYQETYTDVTWGARKLCSLIEEQRNRGQDGAGMAVMKFDVPSGSLYLKRIRNAEPNAIDILLSTMVTELSLIPRLSESDDEIALKMQHDFLGEIYLGHVRYGTHSANNLRCCQPYICKDGVASKSFAIAGNFNMTNSKELREQLIAYGLTPTSESDTHIILELMSYWLQHEHIRLESRFDILRARERADVIAHHVDIVDVLRNTFEHVDGGYVFGGFLGNGDAFVCRDPAGIRPGFFYSTDEVIAVASERAALMHVFDVNPEQIQEVKPGHVLVIKRNGSFAQHQFIALLPQRSCSFERIYFSKASDPAIYQERKALGKHCAPLVLQALDDDIKNAIFTYIPNSGESAFLGLVEELHRLQGSPVRVEKLVYKNQRLRTFITNDSDRCNLVARLYTMTKGIVTSNDTLVVVDDSIVRGTTLRESIIKELIRLNPKRIIFVSSAPPVLYPDCYGIDISQLGNFIAFRAMVELLKQEGKEYLLEEIRCKCNEQKDAPSHMMINYVQKLYNQCSVEALTAKIAELVRPADMPWNGEIKIMYQTVDGLHDAIPGHSGDWYFTGNYPTSGGYKVLNTSYLQWCERSSKRAY
jgi:amidophosphoribosyltransferase